MELKKQNKTIKEKQGISLIVLVITIIVMIILAGVIILSLNNSGIISKASEAVDASNEASVRTYANTVWAEAYLELDRTKDKDAQQQQLEAYVLDKLEDAGIDLTGYSIQVTTKGVTIIKSVAAVVDTVPIPKGFVASNATGENKKNGGLVIYEGTTPVTDANVEEAKRTRNQYVWVPVEGEFAKNFVRQSYKKTLSNTLGADWWEVVLDTATNLPLSTQDDDFVTSTTLAEVQAMYNSVKKYKGFYIARYETGLDNNSHKTSDDGTIITAVHSKMNKVPYNFVRWTYNDKMNQDTNGAVEVARGIYQKNNSNYGVVSTLTYDVQWDTILEWWLATGAVDSVMNSIEYGNYKDNMIDSSTFNEGALISEDGGATYDEIYWRYSKPANTACFLSTGATEEARVNNIYDLAGNISEWTMGGCGTAYRVVRGGDGTRTGALDCYAAYHRNDYEPVTGDEKIGFRVALYIK